LTIWIDAQLSPALASWITEHPHLEAHAVRDLGLRHAKDHMIFREAREAGVIVMTKGADFVHVLARLGPPPQVLWITCGNTSNARLREVLTDALPTALQLFEQGENLVEISDAQ
jgi:predicted nuclease of predicted toxin-antitoxin system